MRISVWLGIISLSVVGWGQGWQQFRGTDGSGILERANVPIALQDEDDVAWKQALPGRGLSSPIVVGERVYVTCASGANKDRLHIRGHAGADGEML